MHSNDMLGVRIPWSLLGQDMLGDALEYLGVSLVVSCTSATGRRLGETPWPADQKWGGNSFGCSPDRVPMIC